MVAKPSFLSLVKGCGGLNQNIKQGEISWLQ